MAADSPSEPRTRRVAATTVDLPGGDTLTFSITGDIFGLSKEARELVYGIVDQLKAFEASLPATTQKPLPLAGPKAKAAEKPTAKDAGPELAS